MTILLRLYRVAQLSADQEQRFLANLFRFSIAVQPCESHGPPLYEVIISAESPGPRYWPYLELEMGESRISGDLDRRIHGGKRMMGNTPPGVPLDLGILVEFARAGSFNISQDYSWHIRDTVTDREARSIDPADVIYESQGTLETQLQLTTTTPDMLVVRSDPELDAAVAAVLKLSAFHFYKTEGTAGGVKRSLIAHMQIGGEPHRTGLRGLRRSARPGNPVRPARYRRRRRRCLDPGNRHGSRSANRGLPRPDHAGIPQQPPARAPDARNNTVVGWRTGVRSGADPAGRAGRGLAAGGALFAGRAACSGTG